MRSETTPLVSVIIPSYNHKDFIEEALLSVIRQDYKNFEVVVVDDGSTDGTAAVAEKVLREMSQPRRLVRQENQGAHAALNAGIALAHGEFVSILNSDDFYHCGRLSRLVDIAFESKANFLFSKVSYVGRNGEPLSLSDPTVCYYHKSLSCKELFPTGSFELLRYNYAITSGNFFFSRRLFHRIGGFRSQRLCHDWDFLLRALLSEEPFFVGEDLLNYRVHGANTILAERDETAEREVIAMLHSYFMSAEAPENSLAPCKKNWGAYWNYFAAKYMDKVFYREYVSFEELRPFLL